MRRLMDDLFLAHPRSMGESYLDHLLVATGFGIAMIVGGIACMVHGVFPTLFTTTGSQTVRALYLRMVSSRRPLPESHSHAMIYEI
jgi:Family of unknown function (DUF6356)